MSTSPTTNYGWLKPNVGTEPLTWGGLLNTIFDQIDALVKTVADAAFVSTPSATVSNFLLNNAPSGWIVLQGTIGNAASNATRRANADTANLYATLWVNFDNTVMPILTSAGVPTTRGANAAADFAANKALTLPDQTGRFQRSFGTNSLAVGVPQADSFQGHEHSIGLRQTSGGGSIAAASSGGTAFNDQTDGIVTNGINGTPRTASETRPVNIAYLTCIKL